MIHSCEGWTAHVVKLAQIDFAVLMLMTSTKISVHDVPRRKLLPGYMGKHTHGSEDTYLHFLKIVYRIAKSPMAIKIAVMMVFRKTTCFS